MKVQELRIENWVHAKTNDKLLEVQINELQHFNRGENIEAWGYNVLQPIPLTEEWWDKFGYECVQEFATVLIEKSKIPLVDNLNTLVPHIESLPIHKIQNLWYELTGSELTIKELA